MRILRAQVDAGDARLAARGAGRDAAAGAGGIPWKDILGGAMEGVQASLAGGGGYAPGRQLADTVKGITAGAPSSAIAQQLAFGDTIPQQQLDRLTSILAREDQIAQNTADMNRALQQGGRLGR